MNSIFSNPLGIFIIFSECTVPMTLFPSACLFKDLRSRETNISQASSIPKDNLVFKYFFQSETIPRIRVYSVLGPELESYSELG